MKRHAIIYLLSFLLAVSVAKADDIATIKSFLDTKTDDQAVLHGVYRACLNLTRTGTEEAVPVLTQLLDDERFSTVARTALVNIPGEAGIKALRDSLQTLKGKHQIAVIQTLGAIRDAKSMPALVRVIIQGDKDIIEASIRALGNIADTDAVNMFMFNVDRAQDMPAIAEAALAAADRLQQDGENLQMVMLLYAAIIQLDHEVSKDAAYLGLLLLEEEDIADLSDLLRDDEISFKVIQRLVLELKSPDTGKIVLGNMGDLSVEQQAALIRNLGARKDSVAVVPHLIALASGDKPELQFAAIEALGEIGDLRAVDTLLLLAGTPGAELANAATESLSHFQGEEFDKKITALLDSNDKNLILAALNIIAERRIADENRTLSTKLMSFFDSRPSQGDEIRAAAYKAFANVSASTFHDVSFVYATLRGRMSEGNDPTHARETLLALCRKTADKDNVVNLLIGHLRSRDRFSQTGDFYLDCLFALGGEKAAQALATVAMGTDGVSDDVQDALTDKATQLLGRWTTPEVAPYLIDIAEKHPSERYRSRTLRGYLRVIRQMGLPVEQKVEMAEKAFAVAQTDADKEQAKEVLERFQAMVKGTPIFDGKTFDGWEFRDRKSVV